MTHTKGGTIKATHKAPITWATSNKLIYEYDGHWVVRDAKGEEVISVDAIHNNAAATIRQEAMLRRRYPSPTHTVQRGAA